MGDWWVTLLSACAAIAVLALLYHGVIRPWHLRWGTIDDEATQATVSRVGSLAQDMETAARVCFEALRLAMPEVVGA